MAVVALHRGKLLERDLKLLFGDPILLKRGCDGVAVSLVLIARLKVDIAAFTAHDEHLPKLSIFKQAERIYCYNWLGDIGVCDAALRIVHSKRNAAAIKRRRTHPRQLDDLKTGAVWGVPSGGP